MRLLQLIITFCILILFGCRNQRAHHNNDQAHIPEAMQEPKKSSLKRAPDDPVNSIYGNLIDKSAELKSVDENISRLPVERNDSTELLMEYINQNDEYYSSAERHIGLIKDSLLKNEILRIMKESKSRFDASINSHKLFVTSIDLAIAEISDQKEMLKLLITLPVIEEYQRLNIPSTKPLQDFDTKLKKLKAKMDSIIKKNGG